MLPSRVNQRWEYSGLDSLDECLNRRHFKQYPFAIEYAYNSRGFRDQEWPTTLTDLRSAVWCIGDSFTVGVGSPIEHTWPWLLQKATGLRTVNISMDGASNNWIAKKTVDVLQKIKPQRIVIHWSYVTRRELDLQTVQNTKWQEFYQAVKDPSWPVCKTLAEFDQLPEYIKQEINHMHGGIPPVSDECLRCQHIPGTTDLDDLNNTIDCINLVNAASVDTEILHSFIPDFCRDSKKIIDHLNNQKINYVSEFSRLDWARDYHHYDIITSQWFVNQITNWLDGESTQ